MDSLHSLLSDIRLVSWDVDGTLYSNLRLAASLARQLVESGVSRGGSETSALFGETWRFHRAVEAQRWRKGAAVVETELDRFRPAAEWERAVLDAALRRTPPRQRARALIERFAAAGTAQVALSDFDCGYKLKALGIDARFSARYSCRALGFWKPSPVPLARIQHDFGVAPNQHLHIGDRPDTDGAACAANGCQFLLIDRLPRPWTVFNTLCAAAAPE